MRDDFNNGIVICNDIVIAEIRMFEFIPKTDVIIIGNARSIYLYRVEWHVQEDDEHFDFIPKENHACFKTIDDIKKFFEIANIDMLRQKYQKPVSL